MSVFVTPENPGVQAEGGRRFNRLRLVTPQGPGATTAEAAAAGSARRRGNIKR